MARVVVVGAGVGGLACAVRLARAGHAVTVLEQGAAAGGKCARVARDGYRFDAGPSLLTMPWLVRELLGDRVELAPVEPVTRYRFADGSSVSLSSVAATAATTAASFALPPVACALSASTTSLGM